MKVILSAAEKRQLDKLETSIEANLKLAGQHYRKAAADLAQVKALSLYRAHGSFEQYCRTRWGIGESRAYQLLAFERVSSTIVEPGQPEETRLREAHARVLDGHEPAAQRAAWAAATADGARPTAARLEALLQADAETQIKAVEDEEAEALANQPAREPRKTKSPREVVQAILRHMKAIGKLVRHLPDIADQAEYELQQLWQTVESTTES